MTKLRKHAAAIALAGLLALFGTACASDDGGGEEGASEPAAGAASEPMASEMAS